MLVERAWPKAKHSKGMVMRVATLIRYEGYSLREVQARLLQEYNESVSVPTLAAWAKRMGITFKGRARLKPCPKCGSHTLHKHNCRYYRVTKIEYVPTVLQTIYLNTPKKV